MPTVAVLSTSFDPPGVHHRQFVALLAERYDRVVVLPAGPRPDQRPASDSLPIHRAVMADLAFHGLPRVTVDLSDLEHDRFTRAHEFAHRFGQDGDEVVIVVGGQHVRGGAAGESLIQTRWSNGQSLWQTGRFAVMADVHDRLPNVDLPPRAEVIPIPPHVPSEGIRGLLFDAANADKYMDPPVAEYIRRHGLFRPTPPAAECLVRLEPRLKLVFDPRNETAAAIARELEPFVSPDPTMVVSIGGDGTMLKAIRAHWRLRRPFYGINAGGLGFLLNAREAARFWERDLLLYHLPMLWVRATDPKGETADALAFNDCWVERATGQTAWVRLTVNGHERLPKVVCDGMLVATAAGSTSYARAMGATPLPFNTPVLTLAGSNVLQPAFWRPAVLPLDSRIELSTADPTPDKRPLTGYIDGRSVGPVARLAVRTSRVAAAELLFDRAHDPVAKLAVTQFPEI